MPVTVYSLSPALRRKMSFSALRRWMEKKGGGKYEVFAMWQHRNNGDSSLDERILFAEVRADRCSGFCLKTFNSLVVVVVVFIWALQKD